MTSIQYGSATVNLVVSTPNSYGSSGANTQQTNLQNLITNNNTVGGMTVTSSNLVVNGAPNNNNSSSDNSNTVLIIAIVVPIASLSTYHFI